MDIETRTIISSLIAKTKRHEAIWNEGNRKGEYQLVLDRAMIVVALNVKQPSQPIYAFFIYNDNGVIAESHYISTKGVEFDMLKELYEIVENAVLKIEVTKQAIIEQINSPVIVGQEDDGLPF